MTNREVLETKYEDIMMDLVKNDICPMSLLEWYSDDKFSAPSGTCLQSCEECVKEWLDEENKPFG